MSSLSGPIGDSLELELVEDGFDGVEEVLLLLGGVSGGGSDSKSLGSDGDCWNEGRGGRTKERRQRWKIASIQINEGDFPVGEFKDWI